MVTIQRDNSIDFVAGVFADSVALPELAFAIFSRHRQSHPVNLTAAMKLATEAKTDCKDHKKGNAINDYK